MFQTLFLSIILLLTSCSSRLKSSKVHYKFPQIEARFQKMKLGYLDKCLIPLHNKKYSERSCAYKLLNSLERSWGLSFNNKQLLLKANELFFAEVEKQVFNEIRISDSFSTELKSQFSSFSDAIKYFKSNHSIELADINNFEIE